MKKIMEIIRLYEKGDMSLRKIAIAVKVSRPSVSQYISDYITSGLKYDEIKIMSDDTLLEIFRQNRTKESERYKKLSDKFEYFAGELKKKGVTIQKLWEEYNEENPTGYSRSQFYHHYSAWRGLSQITMHVEHKAGDKMFIDFTGKKLQITDKKTGLKHDVETFVAVLGASQLTYVQACESQKKEDWIKATEKALWYFGGVTNAIVPDCYKSVVLKADKYDPDINPEYSDFTRHYQTTVLPARPAHPKDKALVEGAVKIVYSWIYASLRNQIFYSIDQLNQAILQELEKYNSKPMQKLKKSRIELFN